MGETAHDHLDLSVGEQTGEAKNTRCDAGRLGRSGRIVQDCINVVAVDRRVAAAEAAGDDVVDVSCGWNERQRSTTDRAGEIGTRAHRPVSEGTTASEHTVGAGETEGRNQPVEAQLVVVLLGDFNELGSDLHLLRLTNRGCVDELLNLVELRGSVSDQQAARSAQGSRASVGEENPRSFEKINNGWPCLKSACSASARVGEGINHTTSTGALTAGSQCAGEIGGNPEGSREEVLARFGLRN